MASTTQSFEHPELGSVQVRKIRTSRHVRLRVQPNGTILLTIPALMSFRAGLAYAEKQTDWIMQNRFEKPIYQTGDKVGREFSFIFMAYGGTVPQARRNGQTLLVKHPANISSADPTVQAAAHKLAHRALKLEAEKYLPDWLAGVAKEYGFTYRNCTIRQLRSRWGSCSSEKDITLNIFLTQLPDDLIEYVLVHELTHTIHLNHSAKFWESLEQILPDAKDRRRRLRNHRPSL